MVQRQGVAAHFLLTKVERKQKRVYIFLPDAVTTVSVSEFKIETLILLEFVFAAYLCITVLI